MLDFCAVAARLPLLALVLNPTQAHLCAFAQVLPTAQNSISPIPHPKLSSALGLIALTPCLISQAPLQPCGLPPSLGQPDCSCFSDWIGLKPRAL